MCIQMHGFMQCSTLQSNLDNLVQWSKTWGMEFNISKCNILSVTNATKNKIKHQYTMDGQALKTQDSTEYLGVTINSKLHWNQHINNINGTANKLISFLWRTVRRCPQDLKSMAYITLVHPKIEYCCSVWDPHHQKYINQLDMVQRRAARFVKNTPYRRSENPTSVTAFVEELGWDSLQNRRLHSRLTMFYRVTQGLVEIPPQYHPKPHPQLKSTKCHPKQFQRHQTEVNAYTYAFLPRTIKDWNALPWDVVAAESLGTFKQRLHPCRQ